MRVPWTPASWMIALSWFMLGTGLSIYAVLNTPVFARKMRVSMQGTRTNTRFP